MSPTHRSVATAHFVFSKIQTLLPPLKQCWWQFEAIEATADCVEACFRQRAAPAAKEEQESGGGAPPPPPPAGGADPAPEATEAKGTETAGRAVVPSSRAFDEDVAGPLATAVMRSLRFFRAAAAGTEAEERDGAHTPAVKVLADGSVFVDDGLRRVALAGLRLAGAVATAPGPARALLAAGGFHVLWRLPLDPAATPMGVALALGALCQGVRHAEVLRVFLTRWRWEGGTTSGIVGGERPGAAELARLGGYEACASVLSRPVRPTGGGMGGNGGRIYGVFWWLGGKQERGGREEVYRIVAAPEQVLVAV